MSYSSEHAVLNPEEQYQAAGWIGVLRVMRDFGQEIVEGQRQISPDRAMNLGAEILRLCRNLATTPRFVLPKLERWEATQDRDNKAKSRLDELAFYEMVHSHNSRLYVNPALKAALMLEYEKSPTAEDIRINTQFKRHEDCIDACVQFYHGNFMSCIEDGRSLTLPIAQIQASTAFYVGDEDRRL
jgi:hypothetical protein